MINILSALAVSAIVAAPTHQPPHLADVDSSMMTLVTVQNDRNVQITIYEEDEFGDMKVGVVPADTTETLRIDQLVYEPRSVRFFVTPQGQSEEATAYLDVDRGEHISLLIPAHTKS